MLTDAENTFDAMRRAVAMMKNQKVPAFEGTYVAPISETWRNLIPEFADGAALSKQKELVKMEKELVKLVKSK